MYPKEQQNLINNYFECGFSQAHALVSSVLAIIWSYGKHLSSEQMAKLIVYAVQCYLSKGASETVRDDSEC